MSNQMNDYQTKATLETFSFLPEFSADEIYDQIVYIINQGWIPSIEHELPENASAHYWGMWKLPMFDVRDPNLVLDEINACRQTYPGHLIRLIGYDNYTQCQGLNFVINRPRS